MSRDKPWLKLWTEWLGDAKMDRLSLAEQGAWWRLVSLAHDCDHVDPLTNKPDGGLFVSGSPLSVAEIMKSLKISDEADKAVFNQMIEKMEAASSLKWEEHALFLAHYEERQRAATDTKEARRKRQQELRDSKKREAEKNPTPPLDENKRREEEGEEETHVQTRHEKSVTIAELARCYETFIGVMNPNDAERMREFTDFYDKGKGKVEWIEKAFRQAPAGKRRWPYIQVILERYIDEGGPDGRSGQAGLSPDRPGPLADTRRKGWKVNPSGPDQPGN